MAKSKQEKMDMIKSFHSESDIHQLLFELLIEMGLNNVRITHERGGKSEDGKDVICSYTNPADNSTEWWAFVVKKGAIRGNSSILADISAQAEECFEFEYVNIIKGLRVRINKVRIVTNDHFSNEAERKIREGHKFQNANIEFWDAEKLVSLIDSKYPNYWIKGSRKYKQYIEKFNKLIDTESISKSLGINDKKVSRILDCAIEPKLSERIEKEDGTFQWKTKTTNSIVKLENNSIIVGDAGTGKTTLFKSLAKEIIEQNALRNDAEFYPILLTFNHLKNSSFNLESAIRSYFNQDWNESLLIDIDEILTTNSCVVFIDALDELPLPSEKEIALYAINSFHDDYPGIRIICSSRPSDYLFYNCTELGFKYLSISPLDLGQVKSFLASYFAENSIKSNRLLKSLRDTRILEKLPKTPLTLALITIIFDETEVEIPATITDLYRKFVDLLIGKSTPDNTIDIIEVGAKHRLLCFLAMYLHSKGRQGLTAEEFKEIVHQYAEERGQDLDVDRIVQDIVDNTGILFVNDKNEIAFKHLSFQEYFTAFEIFHHAPSARSKIVNNFNNVWWQNVAIFYAGMTKDAPELISEVINTSHPHNLWDYIVNTAGLGKLLQALYNSPTESRILGIKQGLSNTVAAVDEVMNNTTIPEVWRSFSKYQIMQLLGSVFSSSFWSITLINPLKQVFDSMALEIPNEKTDSEQYSLEFRLFLICTILASEDFCSYKEIRQLIEESKTNDLSLVASIDMYLRRLRVPDSFKQDDDYQKSIKKMQRKMQSLGNIESIVNAPINMIE